MSRLRVSLATASGRSHATANVARSFVDPTTPEDGRSTSVRRVHAKGLKDPLLRASCRPCFAQDRRPPRGRCRSSSRSAWSPRARRGHPLRDPVRCCATSRFASVDPGGPSGMSKRWSSQSLSTPKAKRDRHLGDRGPRSHLVEVAGLGDPVARARPSATRAPPRARRATRRLGSSCSQHSMLPTAP